MKTKTIIAAAVATIVASAAYGVQNYNFMREPVVFYSGHVHLPNGETIDAPQHSGGLDSAGCHNASVPYHCH
ncbi:MAG: hypothetical protein AAFN79_21400 [Pseudomonadota bacterium]